MDPLLERIDPWAEPDPADGCRVCHNDGGWEDIETGEFKPCPKCYPNGMPDSP